ncbi:hypothetical protein K3495_g12916 [Podosphaera aphanis]|nr:hypothetical protein K3495_g12916 [Podosphaera aphanis]
MVPPKLDRNSRIGRLSSFESLLHDRDFDFSSNLEWLPHFDLAAQLSSANAVSASTPHVVAPAPQHAGIADQQCTPPRSARHPSDVETVGGLTDRIAGTVWLDLQGPVR